jgi:hypothetical protein
MPKTVEEVEKFIEVLEDAGYEPESYSGRGMYGKNCVSLKGDVSVWDVAYSLWFNNFDDEDLDVPEPKTDSLGLGIVIYWPSYEWPKDRD